MSLLEKGRMEMRKKRQRQDANRLRSSSFRSIGQRRLMTSSTVTMRSRALIAILLCSGCTCSRALMSDSLYKGGLFPKARTLRTPSPRMVLTTPESIIEQASTQNLLDYLIDESVRTSARGPIMMQFDPSSGWIWKRWRGTIFSETWDSCVKSMLYAAAILVIFKQFPQLKAYISGFNVLWGQLLSVTTFTLTFFVNQSYALWRKCYELSRRLQGRLHDVGMSLAIHAARKAPSSPNEPSTYTAASRQILELVSRYVRLFNILTYASFTRSHRPILTPRGMRRLVERGLMTPQEREVLVDAEVPATQRHNAVLLWITRVFVEGWQAGHFIGGTGFENQLLEKIHVCRAQYGAIGDELAGRMPLAYAHIVQVLVDAVLWFYPFMAISSQMSDGLVVLGTGLLTMCYQGLFDLAKQFLDPYDNESYGKGEDPLVVDTLIAETNAGSVRWMNSLNEFPVSPQRIKDGELSDCLLPVRGYSVEELAEMEEDRKKRERELQERREREEEERRKKEEKAARIRRAAEAMIPALLVKPPVFEVPGQVTLEKVNGAPGVMLSTDSKIPFVTTAAVADVVSNVNILAGGIPSSLIPRGTAAAPVVDNIVVEQKKEKGLGERDDKEYPKEKSDVEQEASHESVDAAADEDKSTETEGFDDDDAFQVLEDWGADDDYVHTFDISDSYKDLPWFDEVGPDGNEIRLSQLLADEEWEEEKEAAREKQQRIRTYEEYAKRIEEINNVTNSELAETEEILSAAPNAESTSFTSRGTRDKDWYDATKLDGISQLWGSPPGELSDLPSYSEPKISGETEFRGIAQLFGAPEKPLPASNYDNDQPDNEASSFSAVKSLWGGFEEDSQESLLSGGATRSIRDSAKSFKDVQSSRDDTDASWGTFALTEGSDLRLSQILADEVWEEEEVNEELEAAVSFEEYAQQIADILEAEKEEQLETEAILNAPSFAEFVGSGDDDKSLGIKAANSTLEEDDLSVFEMDVTDYDVEATKANKEKLQDDLMTAAASLNYEIPEESTATPTPGAEPEIPGGNVSGASATEVGDGIANNRTISDSDSNK